MVIISNLHLTGGLIRIRFWGRDYAAYNFAEFILLSSFEGNLNCEEVLVLVNSFKTGSLNLHFT